MRHRRDALAMGVNPPQGPYASRFGRLLGNTLDHGHALTGAAATAGAPGRPGYCAEHRTEPRGAERALWDRAL